MDKNDFFYDYRFKGLFDVYSNIGIWVKCSEYEVKLFNDAYYIYPQPFSNIETYNPFEIRTQLMMDFFKMLKSIKEIEDNTVRNSKALKNKLIDYSHWELKQYGKLILEFVRKYGLFGIFFERIDFINYEKPIYDQRLKAILFEERYDPTSVFIKNRRDPISYESYVKGYFPASWSIKDKIPYFEDDRDKFNDIYSRDCVFTAFFRSYCESVRTIICNPIIQSIISRLKAASNFNQQNSDDLTEKQINSLAFAVQPTAVSYYYYKDKKRWMPRFIFDSLITAISIIYLLNLTNQPDSEGKIVRACPVCWAPFERQRLNQMYCTDTCRETRKKRNYRKN